MARRSDHSREEIQHMALQAAESIVDAEGLAGLSTRKVATAIGYTVGTLYLVFKNLDELILHLNAKTLEELYLTLESAQQGCNDPQSCLTAICLAYQGFAFENPGRWALLFEHHLPVDEKIPDWFQTKLQRLFSLIENNLRDLCIWPDQRSLQKVAQSIWSGVHGVCVLHLNNKLDIAGASTSTELIESIIENYIRGYLRDK